MDTSTTSRERTLALTYADRAAFERDVSENLSKARAFVPGVRDAAEREPCRLVLVHPASGERLELRGEVVWINEREPGAGVGVQLLEFDAALRQRLLEFTARSDAETAPPDGDSASDGGAELDEDDGAPSSCSADRRIRNIHERVRALSARERESMARTGSLAERVALERCYGGVVWEGLLQNPQLTPPEVTRLAKNGGLPRPLVSVIVNNACWLAKGEVQRALLGNPRVAGLDLERVLRAMPRAELERVASGTHYRMPVRGAAKKLLGR